MRLHRFSLIAFASAMLVDLIAFVDRCGDVIFRAIDGVLNLFRPEPFRFAGDAHMLNRDIDGRSLDRSLLTSLRHEASVPRRGAMRNT